MHCLRRGLPAHFQSNPLLDRRITPINVDSTQTVWQTDTQVKLKHSVCIFTSSCQHCSPTTRMHMRAQKAQTNDCSCQRQLRLHHSHHHIAQ